VAGGQVITLTTDFGTASPYVAALKGVILDIQPEAALLDLTHQIPPQDIHHAAFFLAEAIPYFPSAALHLVVVDPGVGTNRRLVYVEAGPHRLLAPDNGVLSWLHQRYPPRRAIHLTETHYWRPEVSATFHGRDILAPVAALVSRGLDPGQLGPEAGPLVPLALPAPSRIADTLHGEVVFVDHFGNLLTNLRSEPWPLHAECLGGVTFHDGNF
jgi:hypothetical protein